MHEIISVIQNALVDWLIVDLEDQCRLLSVFGMVKFGLFWWLWVPKVVWFDLRKNIMCKWQDVDVDEGEYICTIFAWFLWLR
jgi:hypothetical protein